MDYCIKVIIWTLAWVEEIEEIVIDKNQWRVFILLFMLALGLPLSSAYMYDPNCDTILAFLSYFYFITSEFKIPRYFSASLRIFSMMGKLTR